MDELKLSADNVNLLRAILANTPIRKVIYMPRQAGKTSLAIELAKKLKWPIIVSYKREADRVQKIAGPDVKIKVLSDTSPLGVRNAIIDNIEMFDPKYSRNICLFEFICFSSNVYDNELLPQSLIYHDNPFANKALFQSGYLIKEIIGSGPTFIFQSLYKPQHFKIDVYRDGKDWCALIGDDIQSGISGFGGSVKEALENMIKDGMKIKEKKQDKMEIHPNCRSVMEAVDAIVEGINRSKYSGDSNETSVDNQKNKTSNGRNKNKKS